MKKSLTTTLPLAVLAMGTVSPNMAFATSSYYRFLGQCSSNVTYNGNQAKYQGAEIKLSIDFLPPLSSSEGSFGPHARLRGTRGEIDRDSQALNYEVMEDNKIKVFMYSSSSSLNFYRETFVTGVDPTLKNVPQTGMIQVGSDVWDITQPSPWRKNHDPAYDETVIDTLGKSYPVTCTFAE